MYRVGLLALVCFLGSGCGGADPDFCSLLSVDEVATFNPDVVASKVEVRGKNAPTRYCIYTTHSNEEVFFLSIGTATKNVPTVILQTYAAYMEGENSVVTVPGVGNSAAALFSADYPGDRFRMLIANNDKWSVTVRAKGIDSEDSPRFATVKKLANRALSRF